MFTKSPFKPKTTLIFIHDPKSSANWTEETDNPYQNCGTVLVPKSTKDKVDSIFQKVFGDSIELDLHLDVTYGWMFVSAMEYICSQKNLECLDFCLVCKYAKKPRMWSHRVYHEVLGKSADATKRTKDELLLFLRNTNPHVFLERYDYDGNRNKIMEEKEALDFILLSFFGRNGHFGNFQVEDELYDRFDEKVFEDCKEGKCRYDYKEEIVWKSKSIVESRNYFREMIHPHSYVKGENYKPEKQKIPRAVIYSKKCVCSDTKWRYELWNWEGTSMIDGMECATTVGISLEPLFHEYFKTALPKRIDKAGNVASAQTDVAAKLMASFIGNGSVEGALKDPENTGKLRHSKTQLKKTLDRFAKVADYWPDLRDVRDILYPGGLEKMMDKCFECGHEQIRGGDFCGDCGAEVLIPSDDDLFRRS